MKNIANQITNDITVSGIDLFVDSESFLNELTDSEIAQITGGADVGAKVKAGTVNVDIDDNQSRLTLLLCN
ncbi:MAG: hypothetical protein V7K41_20035 [Nostoc sp.]|uniref:hypothetical protein n=1 Tax=Nostoc sp. TaxID=1180 RepID=UPI002FF587DC